MAKTFKSLTKKLHRQRASVFQRFPLLFTLLTTFGAVSVFYGFQRLIDRIPLFANNPVILLVFGICLLIFTGTLYKKLG